MHEQLSPENEGCAPPSRRRRLPDSLILLPAGAALAWFACMFVFSHRRPNGRLPAPMIVAQTAELPRMLLVTATPRCPQRHGQFFLTKMLQSKLALARAFHWPVWVLGGGELSASTPVMGAQGDKASSDVHPSSQWPGILQQMIASHLAGGGATDETRWMVWMDSELLLVRPDAFQWHDADADVILLSTGARETGGADASLPSLDLSLAFVRVCSVAAEILSAWSSAISMSGARTSPSVARELLTLLRERADWHRRVRIEDAASSARLVASASQIGALGAGGVRFGSAKSASSGALPAHEQLPWLVSFRECELCAPLIAAEEVARAVLKPIEVWLWRPRLASAAVHSCDSSHRWMMWRRYVPLALSTQVQPQSTCARSPSTDARRADG